MHSTDIQKEANLENAVSNRTVRRALNQEGYTTRQCRKKGQLVKEDLPKRLKWARDKKKLPLSFWRTGICFYLDGSGWTHKTQPNQQVRTKRTRTWMRKDETLSLHCTSKGRKEGVGGKMAHFMVAMAYGKGVVGCHQYHDNLNGEMFADMIKEQFPG